jgi:hypothetical protein
VLAKSAGRVACLICGNSAPERRTPAGRASSMRIRIDYTPDHRRDAFRVSSRHQVEHASRFAQGYGEGGVKCWRVAPPMIVQCCGQRDTSRTPGTSAIEQLGCNSPDMAHRRHLRAGEDPALDSAKTRLVVKVQAALPLECGLPPLVGTHTCDRTEPPSPYSGHKPVPCGILLLTVCYCTVSQRSTRPVGGNKPVVSVCFRGKLGEPLKSAATHVLIYLIASQSEFSRCSKLSYGADEYSTDETLLWIHVASGR